MRPSPLRAALLTLIGVGCPAAVSAASHPVRGGRLSLYSYGAPLRLEPSELRSPMDASLSRAVFEPLFEIGPGDDPRPLLV